MLNALNSIDQLSVIFERFLYVDTLHTIAVNNIFWPYRAHAVPTANTNKSTAVEFPFRKEMIVLCIQPNLARYFQSANSRCVLQISLLLSKGRTVVKCICECNQSGRRVVFYPEPVAMPTTFCGWNVFCSTSALLKVIPWVLPKIPLRNCGSSHQSKSCILIQSRRALFSRLFYITA